MIFGQDFYEKKHPKNIEQNNKNRFVKDSLINL
jgi:hypothetical protein